MSDPLSVKLRDQMIEAIKNDDLESFKAAYDSELEPLTYSDRLDIDNVIIYAAFCNSQKIVDYLLPFKGFGYTIRLSGYAYRGFCKGGHKEALLSLIDRMMPLMKIMEDKINIRIMLDDCIKSGHVDIARTILELLNRKPYSEVLQYGNFDGEPHHPYRSILSMCLACNNTELVEELFEKCVIQKSEINLDHMIAFAKALNAVEFIKIFETWKEKYPYQPQPKKESQERGLVLGNLIGSSIGQLCIAGPHGMCQPVS